MADAGRRSRASDRCLAHHRDTRRWTKIVAGQVSWLAAQRCCPVFPKPSGFSAFVGQLATHSCGDSAGIDTGFPLSSGLMRPENLDTFNYRQKGYSVNLASCCDLLMCLAACPPFILDAEVALQSRTSDDTPNVPPRGQRQIRIRRLCTEDHLVEQTAFMQAGPGSSSTARCAAFSKQSTIHRIR